MNSKLLLILMLIVKILICHPPLYAAKGIGTDSNQSGGGKSLIKQIDEVVSIVKSIRLTTKNPPWVIMHSLYAFGPDQLIFDEENGKDIKILDWICHEGASQYFVLKNGFLSTIAKTPAWSSFRIEDHPDQWLFILSHNVVPRSQQIKLDNKLYSVNDLLESSKREVCQYSELTWTIPAYCNYKLQKSRWLNKFGNKMDLKYLSTLYLKSDWRESACGGTHGLYTLASIKRAEILKGRAGRELNKLLNVALEKARETQNENGSWATEWYNNKQETRFLLEDIHITGHQLEWISLYVSRQELDSLWLKKAVLFLLGRFSRTKNTDNKTFEFNEHPEFHGYICHAVNGLKIYRERLAN
jgi:hypothetical protein